jgi:7-cyano-7-deazaguanine synthase
MSENYKRAAGEHRRDAAAASATHSAVLFSAGLDSAVLAAEALAAGRVQPIYVSVGFAWEAEERAMAARLFARPPFAGRIDPLVTLAFDMRDIFPPSHWAVRGEPPAFDTPDEDVYIHGRNIILAAKAAVYLTRVAFATATAPKEPLALLFGTLAGNPFPDATPEFFTGMSRALTLGLAAPITLEAPFARLHKQDVIRKGIALGVPLELTLSCMQPRDGLHCGQCSKCRERRDAFREAEVEDPTPYRTVPSR